MHIGLALKTGKVISALLCGLMLANVTACSPQSQFSDLVASEGTKEQKLNERVGRYTKAIYWGSVDEASAYFASESRAKLLRTLLKNKKNEKLVDITVESQELEESSVRAKVDLLVRYYKIPTYVVESRIERLTWQFHRINGGWLLHDMELIPVEEESTQPKQLGQGKTSGKQARLDN